MLSNDVVELLPNSDDLKEPTNSVVQAAHTINLSLGVNAAARISLLALSYGLM